MAGVLVATQITIKDPQYLPKNPPGQRLDNDLSIAVDPSNGDTVYIVWGDNSGAGYTLHVRRSLTMGINWSDDLLTVVNANLACLAINSVGTVGLMYQQLVTGRWETHFRRTTDSTGMNWDDIILARTDAPTLPMADYSRLISVGKDFHGVFPAWNTPDPSNFPATPPTVTTPNGAKFLRNASKAVPWELQDSMGQAIQGSVDPFFFKVLDQIPPTPPEGLVAVPA